MALERIIDTETTRDPRCTEGKTCPQVLPDPEPGMALVQGYLPPAKTVRQVAPPNGEGLVRAPKGMLIAKAREWELDDLFDAASDYWRLETLPQYLVDQEAEWLEAWRRERIVHRRTVENSPWLRYVRDRRDAGSRWQRVHVVTQPLSTYLEWQLLSYRDAELAGEDIGIADPAMVADRTVAAELAALDQDYWLLDGDTDHATAVLLRYDSEGHYLGYEISTDRDVLARCRRQRTLALDAAVPLETYLARVGLEPARVA